MSKGLEAWERIKKGIDTNVWESGYWDDIDTIEKELKALEIISNKGIHCGFVKMTENLSDYNANVPFREELTQEEYDLLKEVLL